VPHTPTQMQHQKYRQQRAAQGRQLLPFLTALISATTTRLQKPNAYTALELATLLHTLAGWGERWPHGFACVCVCLCVYLRVITYMHCVTIVRVSCIIMELAMPCTCCQDGQTFPALFRVLLWISFL
jgi:hypothetical protein